VALRKNNDTDLFEMHGHAMNCKWYYNHLTGRYNIRRGSSVAVAQAAKVSFSSSVWSVKRAELIWPWRMLNGI
jgi:hypothetical protein